MFADLCPNKLDWIQLRSASWKAVDVKARMLLNELQGLRRAMDFMIVPDENNRTGYPTKQLLQKEDGVVGAQTAQKRPYG